MWHPRATTTFVYIQYIHIVNWLPINAIKAGAIFHVILFPLDILWENKAYYGATGPKHTLYELVLDILSLWFAQQKGHMEKKGSTAFYCINGGTIFAQTILVANVCPAFFFSLFIRNILYFQPLICFNV